MPSALKPSTPRSAGYTFASRKPLVTHLILAQVKHAMLELVHSMAIGKMKELSQRLQPARGYRSLRLHQIPPL